MRSNRYVFDADTIPQEVFDCLVEKYGSIEAYKDFINENHSYEDEIDVLLFHFDAFGNYWIGALIDSVAHWNYDCSSSWRWADEAETTWYFCRDNDSYDDCKDPECTGDFVSNPVHFQFLGNRLYVFEPNVGMSFDSDCTYYFEWYGTTGQITGLEMVDNSLFNPSSDIGIAPSSLRTRALQQPSAPRGMFRMPLLGR